MTAYIWSGRSRDSPAIVTRLLTSTTDAVSKEF